MKRSHKIRVRVTDDEYDNIKLNADILGMQVAPW